MTENEIEMIMEFIKEYTDIRYDEYGFEKAPIKKPVGTPHTWHPCKVCDRSVETCVCRHNEIIDAIQKMDDLME